MTAASTSARSPSQTRRGAGRPGFTMVELMVSLSAGLLVATAAYALSKNSVEAFQEEARMQASQYSSTLGLTRLANDVKRAGFMTTANIVSDPQRCGPAPSSGHRARTMLQAIKIHRGAATTYANDFNGAARYSSALSARLGQTSNGRRPDRVTLSGNFVTGELFSIATMDNSEIVIQGDTPAVVRVRQLADAGGPSLCDLFFPQDRPTFARVVDAGNRERYVRIEDCSADETTGGEYDTYENIELEYTTMDGVAWAGDPSCGVNLGSSRATINPVTVVDYAVVRPSALPAGNLHASYAQVYAAQADAVTGDSQRTDLVRTEWDADGVAIPGSSEIVGEYVVDLSFAAWEGGIISNPSLTFHDFKASSLDSLAPQRIRGVRIRMGTRARSPDRDDGPDPNAPSSNLPLRRYNVHDDASTVIQRWARVRNAFVDVTLPNLRTLQW